MTEFVITAPDGTKYKVTAPEGASEQDALSFVQSKLAVPAQQPEASTGEDFLKSLGSGVVRGGASLLGTGGDIAKGAEAMTRAAVPVDRQQALEAMPGWLRSHHQQERSPIGSK